jgi:hypothetical protein
MAVDPATPSDETRRAYAAQIAESLRLVVSQQNRLGVLNLVLSLGLIALCAGLVSADEQIDFSGISFSMSLAVLLGLGAAVSAIWTVVYFRLLPRRDALYDEFWAVLESLGQRQPSAPRDPLLALSVIHAVMTIRPEEQTSARAMRPFNTLVTVLVVAASTLLPMASQLLVAVKVATSGVWFGWSVPLFGFVTISLGTLLAWMGDSSRSARRVSETVDSRSNDATA